MQPEEQQQPPHGALWGWRGVMHAERQQQHPNRTKGLVCCSRRRRGHHHHDRHRRSTAITPPPPSRHHRHHYCRRHHLLLLSSPLPLQHRCHHPPQPHSTKSRCQGSSVECKRDSSQKIQILKSAVGARRGVYMQYTRGSQPIRNDICVTTECWLTNGKGMTQLEK